MAFSKLINCLACGSSKLSNVLDLNKQPLANSFLKKKNSKEQKYELKVNACLECTHLQLSIAINPKKIYRNYNYVSGTTETYKNYMKKFYKISVSNTSKFLNKNILDIGCNDGSQLNVYKSKGFKTFGVDPAKNIFKISSKNHNIICDFFNSDVVKKLDQKFDLIISQNSFAHNPKPLEFLSNARDLMHDKSSLIIQTSQADMCKNFEFDTIYHEHINFFNIKSMLALLKRSKLKLHNVIKDPIHGSSYLFIIRLNSNQKKIASKVKKEKFLDFKFYKKWGHKCKKYVKKTKSQFDKITNNKTVIGYGAAAKANTFLNFSKINMSYIIDDNKLKQNKFCPGSKIQIKSLMYLKNLKQDIYIVPLAWNFFKEIKFKIKSVRNNKKDKLIIFYPKFKVIRV